PADELSLLSSMAPNVTPSPTRIKHVFDWRVVPDPGAGRGACLGPKDPTTAESHMCNFCVDRVPDLHDSGKADEVVGGVI
ncbi:hypothetical protein, partial [Mycobacterium avium]